MDVNLVVIASGASAEQKAMGARAAAHVLRSAGLSPEAAHRAHEQLARAEAQAAAPDASPAMARAARTWQIAGRAAMVACCGTVPADFRLLLGP
ncbi:hypothetical protein DES41_10378 [Pseudorhodoferax soli]|uniref:Uncharacterized protein n=2 Tax=Pseudorhodoferax soli TaxID=545864 RepID=A0A368XWX2_9BURK|nr:hypothetical protein DES41_10378 [Pseudorhodoferax soli]